MASDHFKPALLVVDLQEDFCPPDGALAVPDGRDVVPTVNELLTLPFVVKVATKDWHPVDHVSFAANHAGKRAFADTVRIAHPRDPDAAYESRLWPVHCVRHSAGARLVPELDAGRVDRVLEKGGDAAVEMYSAFHDPLRVCDSGLAAALRAAAVSHVYVVGLAADYCVRHTALDAHAEGFVAYVVDEGTRPVDVAGWPACRTELERAGVRVVGLHGPEVQKVRDRSLT